MDYQNNTALSRKNKHLNSYERGQIELLLKQGHSAYRISKILERPINTIRNEMKRGSVGQIRASKLSQLWY